ncbi:MAG: polyamine aminopropyltransferase [Pseudomonadota bacterium]
MTKTTRFFDQCDASHGLYFDATAVLHHSRSPFQDIKIIETVKHGRVLFLDNVTMLTQSTHHVYHEHMVHIPMACVAAPKAVLVIGGGDGGTVSELVKYPAVTRIVLCELDGDVVDVSKRFLPDVSAGLSDPRVDVQVGDGAAYLESTPGQWDVVIVDSTDICEEAHEDGGIANPLATDAFFDSLRRGLKPGGVAVSMLGSPTFYRSGMEKLFHRLAPAWASFRPMLMPCPFYISGDWCAGVMSDEPGLAPVNAHDIRGDLKYVNVDIAAAALVLPNEVKRLMPPFQPSGAPTP